MLIFQIVTTQMGMLPEVEHADTINNHFVAVGIVN